MKGIDVIIDKLKTANASLDWIEMSYGRAFLHQEKRDNKIIKLPKCWVSTGQETGDYINVLPNDNYKAMSFVYCRGPEKNETNDVEGFDFKSRDLSIIYWFDQTKISNNSEYIVSELKAEVETALAAVPEIEKITQIFDEKIEDIFSGYTIDEVKTPYLMYPFGGLRFDVTVKYRDTCN